MRFTDGGLFLGVSICFGLNMLDNSFKTVDQAELQLELPAVAAVPKGKEGNSYESGFVIVNEPHGAIAESFRTLRTSLSLLGRESERKVFLFTSALPGEGKSFCSTNYAISLATRGYALLLIDADLRLPTLGRTFFKSFPPGVSELLTATLRWLSVPGFRRGRVGIMTAGHRAPIRLNCSPAHPWGPVRDARLKYDGVVIDSAPVPVSDSLLLLKHVQTVCPVQGQAARHAVMRAVQRLTDSGSRTIVFVLNRLPPHSGANVSYHFSAGEYGKGVYGAPARRRIAPETRNGRGLSRAQLLAQGTKGTQGTGVTLWSIWSVEPATEPVSCPRPFLVSGAMPRRAGAP